MTYVIRMEREASSGGMQGIYTSGFVRLVSPENEQSIGFDVQGRHPTPGRDMRLMQAFHKVIHKPSDVQKEHKIVPVHVQVAESSALNLRDWETAKYKLRRERVPLSPDLSVDMLFGFSNTKQLDHWFNAHERQLLCDAGAVISLYEVHDECVFMGDTQCVYLWHAMREFVGRLNPITLTLNK